MDQATVFGIMLVIFAVLLLWGGWYTRRWITGASDLLMAGREVSLLINVFGVAAIGFAGTAITVFPGMAIRGGFWQAILWGASFTILGYVVYGLFFTPVVRRCGANTLPEWTEVRFSQRTRTLITICTTLGLLGILANNVLSMGTVVTGLTGIPLWITISICFFVFLFFTYIGGFWAVTLTDFIQLIIGLVGVPLIIGTLLTVFGGWDFVAAKWAGNPFCVGMTGKVVPWVTLKYPSIFMSYMLFGIFLVWGNHYYWLRAATCRSERVARNSYIWAGILVICTFAPALSLIGLYAAAANPGLFAPVGKMLPEAAYGVILRSFPPVIASYLLIVALAASISTSATAHIGATTTVVRDIYRRVFHPEATDRQLVAPTRVLMLVLGLLTWGLCFYPGGPLYLFAFANAWLGPASVLVFFGFWWRRTTEPAAFWGGLVAVLALMVWTITDLFKLYPVSQIAHVGAVGLILTPILVILITFVTKPKYYGEASWQKDSGKKEVISLNETELQVLRFIQQGYNTSADITDLLQTDSSVSNAAIEKLDEYGYITRQALSGAGFYTFQLTAKGQQALPPLSPEEEELSKRGLTGLSLQILTFLQQNPRDVLEIPKKFNLTSTETSVLLDSLVRSGYLRESGIWRRYVHLTPKAEETLRALAA